MVPSIRVPFLGELQGRLEWLTGPFGDPESWQMVMALPACSQEQYPEERAPETVVSKGGQTLRQPMNGEEAALFCPNSGPGGFPGRPEALP